MSEFSENAGATLLHYIREQTAIVRQILSGEIYDQDDPRYDICLRHEADKLNMLKNIAEDAGYSQTLEAIG